MMHERIGIGFVGGGFITRFHIQSLIGVRNCDVIGIMSRTTASAEESALLARTIGVGQATVFDNVTNLPISSTASFYDFIVLELIPYLKKNYRISKFNIIIGHERTANFINFLVLKDKPLVRGAICISPKFSENMQGYIVDYFKKSKNRISYSISTSQKDFESIYQDVLSVSKSLDSIDNKYLNFKSIVLKDENHYVVPSVTIPKSIKLPNNQQDRDMIARELLVKFQMSPKHPLVDLKKAYLKF